VTAILTTLEWDAAVGNALLECAVARGGRIDGIESHVYLRQLSDLDAGVLTRALDALGREPRKEFETYLPPVPMIRQRVLALARADAEAEAAAKLLPLPSDPEADPRTWVHCMDCRDESSGWREFFCHGAGSQKNAGARPYHYRVPTYYCGKKGQHPPHPYVERCGCYATNPVIAQRREAQAVRRAAAREQA